MTAEPNKLHKKLTAAGKTFLTRLNKALAEEFAKINNVGGDAILAEIERHHMRTPDSVKSINRLAAEHRKARLTGYYMIMNYARMLLDTDGRHRSRGILTPTGEQLLLIWQIYANKLVDADEATQAEIDAEEAKLMQTIKKTERGGTGSLLGRLLSVFTK